MKHLLKLGGMTPEEILHILDVADEYKRLHKDGVDPKDLQGKAVALVFAKNSTRTRTSLEVGIYQMGGLGTYLSAGDLRPACWGGTMTPSSAAPTSRRRWTCWQNTAVYRWFPA